MEKINKTIRDNKGEHEINSLNINQFEKKLMGVKNFT